MPDDIDRVYDFASTCAKIAGAQGLIETLQDMMKHQKYPNLNIFRLVRCPYRKVSATIYLTITGLCAAVCTSMCISITGVIGWFWSRVTSRPRQRISSFIAHGMKFGLTSKIQSSSGASLVALARDSGIVTVTSFQTILDSGRDSRILILSFVSLKVVGRTPIAVVTLGANPMNLHGTCAWRLARGQIL